ncbi:hypothetical protein [Dokdonia sp.]|uniref:hypothetical protein n=1 Tax=Dokdonia sp. TaxID=2024995 RepID=UPI0032649CC3
MHLIYIILLLFYPNEIRSLDSISQETIIQSEIPQGKMTFELYFSEWDGRMPNTSVDVIIKGTTITVLKNKKTNLTGETFITKGILIKHTSGVWIIAEKPSDKDIEEIGGCTGGPIPINFKKKIIEWC